MYLCLHRNVAQNMPLGVIFTLNTQFFLNVFALYWIISVNLGYNCPKETTIAKQCIILSFNLNSLADAGCLPDKLYHSAAEVEITADFEMNLWLWAWTWQATQAFTSTAPGLPCVSNLTKKCLTSLS